MGMIDSLKGTEHEPDLPYELFAASFKGTITKRADAPEDISGYFLPKSFTCPICDYDFMAIVLRESKLRLLSTQGLRPVYKDIEPLCYDTMMCVNCGYAATSSKFDLHSERQTRLLTEGVRTNYMKYLPLEYPFELDYKMAIERNKYALLSACVKKSTVGEKAYLLMKTAWLYELAGDEENELLFSKYAYEYWSRAYQTERPPIFGLSEAAVTYLLSEYAYKMGDHSIALKHLSEIIVNQELSSRLRGLATELKEKIMEKRAD